MAKKTIPAAGARPGAGRTKAKTMGGPKTAPSRSKGTPATKVDGRTKEARAKKKRAAARKAARTG